VVSYQEQACHEEAGQEQAGVYSLAGANILIPGVVILSKAVTLLKDAVIFSTRVAAQSNAPS
jgi:hypothetical protein